jgi:cell division cycle 14
MRRGSLPKQDGPIELIPQRLYFLTGPAASVPGHAFSIDRSPEFQYSPFFQDFGPPSLLHIHRFNAMVEALLDAHPEPLYFYCSGQAGRLANAVLFISAFLMFHLRTTPGNALRPFAGVLPKLKMYRDASPLPQTHYLTVGTCLEALAKARRLGWYDAATFHAADWAKYERVPNGDMNWIIPGKLLAFATAYPTNVLAGNWRVATPHDLVPTFRARGITAIVRLCERFYNEKLFTKAGFKFHEMAFEDGSCPPVAIREEFLRLCESADVVAVHCKAGLGRTGTLIGCHLIKRFGFTGDEAIGWLRICRPGSVIGPQQTYLVDYAGSCRQRPNDVVPVVRPATSARAQVDHSLEVRGESATDACQPRKYRTAAQRSAFVPRPETAKGIASAPWDREAV